MLGVTDHGHPTLKLGVWWIIATSWMDPEDIMLRELCQSQKDKCYTIPLTSGIEKSQRYRSTQWNGSYWGWGGVYGVLFSGYKVIVIQED